VFAILTTRDILNAKGSVCLIGGGGGSGLSIYSHYNYGRDNIFIILEIIIIV